MSNDKRLIEVAFPLKQVSLDSVHEKNVRHGHISTLHIWPARRPLAACRAALIATLLPDPGDADKRREILERMAGSLVQKAKKKKLANGKVIEEVKEETEGGILHWGRESGPDLDWFRSRIREAYGGRAPKVLDPFAGGGAIPLEAMRLGCEATAIDINPVAWFLLKCTLEYPQRLAGKTWPLPDFWREVPELAAKYGTAATPRPVRRQGVLLPEAIRQAALFSDRPGDPEGDLADHVRAWGWWVLREARKDLERFYPVIDGKPAVAYLWARTVACKNCRATIPLLKTRWLCKKENKRVVLAMSVRSDKSGVDFDVVEDVPSRSGRGTDRQLGGGTMTRSGATCPCCSSIMTMEDIRLEGRSGRLGALMTAVVVDGPSGKEYRVPHTVEIDAAARAGEFVPSLFDGIPYGIPSEPLPTAEALGFRVPLYGFDRWSTLFTPRQLLALGVLVRATRSIPASEEQEPIAAYLSLAVDRVANRGSSLAFWNMPAEKIEQTFARFALPVVWDFAESNPLASASGNYAGEIEWITLVLAHLMKAAGSEQPIVNHRSAMDGRGGSVDVIVTDPPYYDAIPYSDLMDFFYVWLRRTLAGLSPDLDKAFATSLGPKWDHTHADGELIDDSSRFGGDARASRQAYEDGMAQAFAACGDRLDQSGRLVIVFANKQPEAWETLVSAIIRAGFVVDGSWPIMTERQGGVRNYGRASLSSSIWLVCRKRSSSVRPGWDNVVIDQMRRNIGEQLHGFWDAGIRGPDFVWAATGPALEAYSQHPVVKKANSPGEVMTVSEFLGQVRRIVVDFVVGRVLSGGGQDSDVAGLDDVTTYYLLHRHDFGMESAPAGAAILYAVSCGLSDRELVDRLEVLERSGGKSNPADDEQPGEASEADVEGEGSGSEVRLRAWNKRLTRKLADDGKSMPLINQIHHLMHLWRAGDANKVEDFVHAVALTTNPLYPQVLQALIELSPAGSEERATLESLANHARSRGIVVPQAALPYGMQSE